MSLAQILALKEFTVGTDDDAQIFKNRSSDI